MSFRRHRVQQSHAQPSDDEEEDDVFSALSRKRSKKKAKLDSATPKPAQPSIETSANPANDASTSNYSGPSETPVVASTTSSMKRHHKPMQDHRRAKMEETLAELQFHQQTESSSRPNHRDKKRRHGGGGGSYVEPGQENITTNIFVSNLATNLTEEALHKVFGSFGDLFSVKIMWPRSAEERARQRLTGFVCFYDREHAEACFSALSDTDAFGNGRRIMLSWGKHVLPDQARRQWASQRRTRTNGYGGQSTNHDYTSSSSLSSPASQSDAQIKVIVPSDKRRARFITLIAKFVARDGSDLEDLLVQQHQQGNIRDNIDFLRCENNREEHIFYKWRVFAFTQGDGDHRYRTQPFKMVIGGCTWIPPPIDEEAARHEDDLQKKEEETLRRQLQQKDSQRQRRRPHSKSTHARPLTQEELNEFHSFTREQLCSSREAIAAAMAFCFDKCSFAIDELFNLLKELLLQSEQVSVDTRIARLYLISDILFNSQQPGVKNAFAFRTKIEQVAPAIFQSLGEFTRALPRMPAHKMRKAISAVLAAWTNWSVYNPAFLDELEDKFEGRQPTSHPAENKEEEDSNGVEKSDAVDDDKPAITDDVVVMTAPSRNWKDVNVDQESEAQPLEANKEASPKEADSTIPDAGEPQDLLEDDADGEELEEDDADGEALSDVDGEIIEEDVDGDPLE